LHVSSDLADNKRIGRGESASILQSKEDLVVEFTAGEVSQKLCLDPLVCKDSLDEELINDQSRKLLSEHKLTPRSRLHTDFISPLQEMADRQIKHIVSRKRRKKPDDEADALNRLTQQITTSVVAARENLVARHFNTAQANIQKIPQTIESLAGTLRPSEIEYILKKAHKLLSNFSYEMQREIIKANGRQDKLHEVVTLTINRLRNLPKILWMFVQKEARKKEEENSLSAIRTYVQAFVLYQAWLGANTVYTQRTKQAENLADMFEGHANKFWNKKMALLGKLQGYARKNQHAIEQELLTPDAGFVTSIDRPRNKQILSEIVKQRIKQFEEDSRGKKALDSWRTLVMSRLTEDEPNIDGLFENSIE